MIERSVFHHENNQMLDLSGWGWHK